MKYLRCNVPVVSTRDHPVSIPAELYSVHATIVTKYIIKGSVWLCMVVELSMQYCGQIIISLSV